MSKRSKCEEEDDTNYSKENRKKIDKTLLSPLSTGSAVSLDEPESESEPERSLVRRSITKKTENARELQEALLKNKCQ